MIICIYTRTSTLAQRSGTSRSSRKAWDRSIWSTIRATRCGPMERSATSTQRTTLIFEFVSRMYTCMLKNCRPTNANGSTMNTSPDAAFEQLQNKVGEECEHQNEARYRCVPTLIYKSWTAACIFHYIYINIGLDAPSPSWVAAKRARRKSRSGSCLRVAAKVSVTLLYIP